MALDAVKKAGVKLQIGFVRRFDHNHRGVYDAVRSGKIGTPHILRISSRDPQPPTIAYVRRSGGIFYDMMIHDFDMIRFLAGCEVTEVYAKGAVLVDPAIGAEGDVDTAIVTLTFENGAIGVIDNSRQAVYGYDQRLEVFGSEGAVQDENDIPNTVVVSRADICCCQQVPQGRQTGQDFRSRCIKFDNLTFSLLKKPSIQIHEWRAFFVGINRRNP